MKPETEFSNGYYRGEFDASGKKPPGLFITTMATGMRALGKKIVNLSANLFYLQKQPNYP